MVELVEDGHLGVAHQGNGDRQPLPLTTGEHGEAPVAGFGQPQLVEQAADRHRVAVERGEHFEQFADPHPVGEPALLELDPDPLPQLGGVPAGLEPEHPDGSAVRLAEPGDRLHRRCLAGAIGPEDGEDLALLDLERDALDDGPPVVTLDQVVDFDDHCHTRLR